MSIANEITNYANGLSDAYDAVNDMQGLIPQDKNMNNLDTSIRTIPQNLGPTYTAGNGIVIDANDEISIDDTVVAELSDLPSDFTGATSLTDGTAGLVPKPLAGDETKFLSGNGQWTTVSQYSLPIASANDLGGIKVGSNLSIDAGTGVLSATVPTVNDATLTITQNGTTAGTFTANSNTSTTVALTDTTYSDFTGATSLAAGSAGLVPAPTTSDPDKFLKGDGTWGTPTDTTYTAGNGINITNGGISVDTSVVATQTDLGSYVTLGTNQNITGEKTFVGNKRIKFKGTASNSKLGFTSFDQNNGETGFLEVEGTSTGSKKIRLGCYDQASGNARDNYVGFQYHNTKPVGGGTVSYNLVCPPQYKGISGTNAFAYIPVDFTDGNTTVRSGTNGTVDISTLLPSYSAFTGATSSTAGAAGLVPAPAAGDQDKVLSGAGTWVAQSGGTTYTAGSHIDITSDVISAIDYVSADSPTAAVSPSSPVTTPMIADGAVTSAKIATGVVPQITMTNVDPGEGTPLADNNFIAVYDTTGSLLDMFYPVGSYYETSNTSFNPNTAWGGTWVEDSAGFVTVAKDSGTFATVGDTGGIENTNHAFWRPPLNSSNFQDPGQNYVGDIETRVNAWLQTGGSSALTLSTAVAGKGGTIRTNGTTNTECGFFKYTSTTLQPYVVVKRWHRTA